MVLATGDLSELGGERKYIALRDLLADLTMPVYLIPGNHDIRPQTVIEQCVGITTRNNRVQLSDTDRPAPETITHMEKKRMMH